MILKKSSGTKFAGGTVGPIVVDEAEAFDSKGARSDGEFIDSVSKSS